MTNNYIDEDAVYIDGTKIEADANKYTFVWKANTERYSKANMKKSKEVYDELMVNEILPSLKEELEEIWFGSTINNSQEKSFQIQKLHQFIKGKKLTLKLFW